MSQDTPINDTVNEEISEFAEEDSLDKADSDQLRKQISAMDAAREIDHLSFDDLLARLEDLEKLQFLIPEAAAKDQIQTLKMEIKFLKTFSKFIARNGNLKARSASAISAIKLALWGPFSKYPAPGEVGIPVDAVSALSDALKVIEEYRPKIKYFYNQVSASSDSYTHMTTDLVLEFINDLKQNLKDLLRSKAALVVSFKNQFASLKAELQFLQNFLDFAEKQCSEQESLNNLLKHSEVVAIDLARLSYTFLASTMNEEPSAEMNLKLFDLLQEMKATKPEVRQTYIRVLKASQFSESSDKHVLGAFVDCLQHYLLEFLNSKFRVKHPVQDQLKILDEKLRFMRILLLDPPRKDIYMRAIDAVTSASDLLLFSLDEMTEEIVVHMNLKLVNLLQTMNQIEGMVKYKFPRIGGLCFIQSFVENLEELRCQTDTSIAFPKHLIETIQKHFEFFISLLRNMEMQLDQNEDLKNLRTQLIDLAYQTEYLVDSFLVEDGPGRYNMLWLSDILEQIQIVKAEVIEFNTKMVAHDTGVDNVKNSSSNALFSRANSPTINERVVGFEDEEEKLIELLMYGSSHLDIVSLVGMGGQGKTTLSKKIFNSQRAQKHFHARGWCSVSAVDRKMDILTSLLNQVSGQKNGEDKGDACDLELALYRRLKGRKYLIVLDDIWDIEAWHKLKLTFPDDDNGSRIMFTTRDHQVAMKAKLHSNPHSLRPFRDDESWKLLQQLVFSEGNCPMRLEEIGKQIAKSCKGVPLSVALTSGILATNKSQGFWNQVSQSLTSTIFSREGQTKDIIEKSYKHLPHHLRSCFLYFGAFLEDQDIPVKKLKWLWNAEGFVRKPEGGIIEQTAEDYLNTLISRSLVTISKRKSDGRIKECRVHDLLYHFCKEKSREENFWQFDGFVLDYGVESNSSPATPKYEQIRLCMYYQGDAFIKSRPSGSHVRSLILHDPVVDMLFSEKPFLAASDRRFFADISWISNSFKLLRVLDLERLYVDVFPDGIGMLVLLKYLALKAVNAKRIPASIGTLWNLETFVLLSRVNGNVIMPETIWKMRKLRHLHIRRGVIFDSDYQIGLRDQRQASPEEDSNLQMLYSLETISNLCLSQGEEENVLRKIPNVRKLSCSLEDSSGNSSNGNQVLSLDLLRELESLSVYNFRENCKLINFPLKLKKLALTAFNLAPAEISIIGRLENLEVLKLRMVEFDNHCWDMVDEEFPSLRHLELEKIIIKEWKASSDNFPCLQRLRLLYINKLRGVPSCFETLPTLDMIEVKECYDLDLESVWKIQREQKDMSNQEFKVIVSKD